MNTTLSLHFIQVKQVRDPWGRVGRRMVGNSNADRGGLALGRLASAADLSLVAYPVAKSTTSLPSWVMSFGRSGIGSHGDTDRHRGKRALVRWPLSSTQ